MVNEELLRRKREEYEMQLFAFHSRDVCTTLTTLIKEKIESRCKKIHQAIINKYNPVGEEAELLKRNRKKLTTAYYRKCRSYLPRIENCVEKLLAIPQHILLDEDKIQATQFTAEEFDEIMRNLEDLQRRTKQATMLNGVLKQELEMTEEFENNIEVANKLCTAIENGIHYSEIDDATIKAIDQLRNVTEEVEEFCSTRVHRLNCLTLPPKEFSIHDL
ncbi:hypothetical protein G9C98_002697 [Cotesia typhae]|uniref:Uncharacterized protein n=1 Tax=Cotesia typhae TaxID=2053667 RepID=A0A8J5RG93_9HYME|nr:hypothetical protein G9C98_002697 [Cotesia typhae]